MAYHRHEIERSSGFTLIELMIVVAIIGILASIAIPNMNKFRLRARQSEAKTNLRAIYSAIKANFHETGKYSCGFCGWETAEVHYYNYYVSNAPDGQLTDGTHGCAAGAGGATPMQTDPSGGSDGSFVAVATANLDGDATCDGWSMDDENTLVNTKNDVEE